MTQEIEAYQIAWHKTQGCQLRIKLKNNITWSPVMSVNASDLAAAAAILNQKPVFLTDGWIHTGPELIQE